MTLYCSTLQHTATHCNTLQHTAAHCNTLQHTATHTNDEDMLALADADGQIGTQDFRLTLQHTATHCNTLQHAAIHCNTLQHTANTATHCNTLQHTATRCNTLQHTATHCNTHQRSRRAEPCGCEWTNQYTRLSPHPVFSMSAPQSPKQHRLYVKTSKEIYTGTSNETCIDMLKETCIDMSKETYLVKRDQKIVSVINDLCQPLNLQHSITCALQCQKRPKYCIFLKGPM